MQPIAVYPKWTASTFITKNRILFLSVKQAVPSNFYIMLINNLNNWFNNNPSSHYASQPNFNLSDYQQIEQTSEKSSTNGNHHNQRVYSANTSAAKDSFNRIRKGSNQLVHKKQMSPNQQSTPSHIKYQKQPHPVKKQIKSAFSPQIKSRSTLNLSNTNSSSANNINSSADHNVVNTAICELTSKTCTNFSQPTNQANSFDVESSTVNTSEQNRRLNDPRAKFASNLDLRWLYDKIFSLFFFLKCLYCGHQVSEYIYTKIRWKKSTYSIVRWL